VAALGFRQIGGSGRRRSGESGSGGSEHNGADGHGGSPPVSSAVDKQETLFAL
jgi:hypothetical protein